MLGTVLEALILLANSHVLKPSTVSSGKLDIA
jgi:hypothetical protein